MKRYFTGGLALLLALNLALPGSTVTLAEDMATSSDMDASMPTATATAMPTATVTAAPTAEATAVPTATATPEVAANGPAYYLEGETRRYGELAELIPLAQALGQPVYLASAKVYELPGWTLEQASDLALALDTTVFPEENRVVMLSETNPAGNSAENTVYLWVGFKLPVEEGSNGGASWYPVTEMGEGVWGLTFTAAQAYTFAPGTIVARDGAGNLAAYEKEVTLQSSQGRPSGGFSGGGGGGSSSTVATTHATSDTTAVVAYDGVELVVADQPMSSLVMGETELELFLRPDESLLARLGEDYQPAFTATLSNWMEDASDTPDTLVLAVSQEDLAQAEDAAFTWDFNGTVYKKLAASGIDYLVLQVGDQVTALSTAGFAAGVRYTMYRAQGLSSEAFDYHVSMTEAGETALSVTVAGETWLLTEEEGGAFYYYDVYTGTLEELAQAKEG